MATHHKNHPKRLSPSPRTAQPSEKTKILQNQVLDLYRDNPNYCEIARIMGISHTYVKKLYKAALKDIIVDNVDDFRKLEMARLDKLHVKAMQVLEAFHPLVNSGVVVRDNLEDADGNPLVDETTGELKTYRLQDQGPLLAAIDRVLKVSERRARLLGLDTPTKVALTNPEGDKEASFVQFYIPANGRDAITEELENAETNQEKG